MRKQDRARTNQDFIDGVLNDAQEIYVGFSTPQAPYVIPLNFAYWQGKIYIHCAHEGHKLDCIKANAKVGFSTATDIKIIAEKATTAYRSISGTGKACIVHDKQEKCAALNAIATRYAASCQIPATDKMIEKTTIVSIEIDSIMGKCNEVSQID